VYKFCQARLSDESLLLRVNPLNFGLAIASKFDSFCQRQNCLFLWGEKRCFLPSIEGIDSFLRFVFVLNLAHSLGIEAIAEGIETAQQLAQLKELDCEYGQGYFFCKPLDAKKAAQIFAAD
jgi:EAL domain